jgi:hypothetical protein
MSFTGDVGAEAERQLTATVARHREVVGSGNELGRPEAGQHVAVKAVERAVRLVSFALRRAAGAGVPFDRLVELTGWEPGLVRAGLEQEPEPLFVARLVPAGLDPDVVAQTAAGVAAMARLDALTREILAEAEGDEDWSPGAGDLDDLSRGLARERDNWRQRRPELTLGADLHAG